MSSSQVVREMQRANVFKRDWRSVFGVFTVVLSAISGTAVLFYGVPEKDFKGRDHVFSGVQRYYKRKRDEFFGLPPATSANESKEAAPAGQEGK